MPDIYNSIKNAGHRAALAFMDLHPVTEWAALIFPCGASGIVYCHRTIISSAEITVTRKRPRIFARLQLLGAERRYRFVFVVGRDVSAKNFTYMLRAENQLLDMPSHAEYHATQNIVPALSMSMTQS